MHLIEGEFYHIYNRGNNKQQIFFNDENYLFFLRKIREQLSSRVDILAYCLMPNHFHMLICANEKSITEKTSFGRKSMQEFAYKVGIMLSSYTQAINKQNNTTGSLFQQKTKAKILCAEVNGGIENYIENCFFYIHRNPLAAGLVKNLNEWIYSSYLDYIGQRNGTLCNRSLFFKHSGLMITDIIGRSDNTLPEEMIRKLY
jgi:putative transposase